MAEQVDSWLDLPAGTYEGVNRYSTDDEEVLSLWRAGQTWDLRAALAADTGQQVESPVRPSKGEGDMAAGLRMAGFPDPRIAELAVTVERLTGALEAIVQGYDRGHILGSDLILQARAALAADTEEEKPNG